MSTQDFSLLSDSELAKKVKDEADNGAVQELIVRHSGIYHQIALNFLGSPNFPYQDIVDDKPFTIYSAALSYDDNKGKFDTYLGNITKYKCLNVLNERNGGGNGNYRTFVELDSTGGEPQGETQLIVVSNPANQLESKDALDLTLQCVGKMSKDRQRVFKKRYFTSESKSKELRTWGSIAKSEGKTKWNCILKHRKVTKELREKLGVELRGKNW
jgi:DNA-directed RNA polymerase specialized sigma24 family protein